MQEITTPCISCGDVRRNDRGCVVCPQLSKFGITGDQYRAMLERQRHRCALCLLPFGEPSLVNSSNPHWRRESNIDHDHLTNRVRGVLCTRCNRSLGWFESLRCEVEAYL
jgi:hypothetical protein